MPISVSARSGGPEDTSADTRVVPLFEDESLPGDLQALVDSGEAKPALRKLAVTHEDGRRVIVVGLGKRDELDPEKARLAAAAVASRAKEIGSKSLSWEAPEGTAGAVVEGTLLALYRFDRFKSDAGDEDDGITSLEVSGDQHEVTAARAVAEAQNRARDLQNLPSNVATPTFLAERAAEIAEEHASLEVELMDGEA